MKEKLGLKLKELYAAYNKIDLEKNYGGALFSGAPGILLFKLYYLKLIDENDEKLTQELVEFVLNEIQKPIATSSFCDGIGGFAWFLNHIRNQDFLDLEDDLFHDFDEVILNASEDYFNDQNHDFLHGGLGIMLYLIERSKQSKKVQQGLPFILEKLIQNGEVSEKYIYWVESDLMLDHMSKNNKVVNLHLSHGQASKIVILSKMILAGVEGAEEWCRKAVDFMLANEISGAKDALLPTCIVNDEKDEYMHLGWCRGNISMSISLLIAAKVLDDPKIYQKAIEIGKHTLKHDSAEKAKVSDVGFCHGTAGLSYMYNTLYNMSKQNEFKKAADLWMEKTLNASQFDDGIAGFKLRDGLTKEWVNDYGLLTGTAGVGLAMIGQMSSELTNWDECFLLH